MKRKIAVILAVVIMAFLWIPMTAAASETSSGEEKFGVEISKEDAKKLVNAMKKLEDMGFSAEEIIEKTENLYQEYGSDFVNHVDEVVTGAVKNAVADAINSFFENLTKSVKKFFTDLFS